MTRYERARDLATKLGARIDTVQPDLYSLSWVDRLGNGWASHLTLEELERRIVEIAEEHRTMGRIATQALREWMAGR